MASQNVSRKVLFLLASMALLIMACKKDPAKENQQPDQAKKLVRVSENATNYTSFEYNSDGTLKRLVSSSDEDGEAEMTEITYSYNEQKKVTGLVLNGAITCKYVYDNNRIRQMELYTDDEKQAYYEFNYRNDKITRVTNYYKNGSTYKSLSKTECTYYDNGNVKDLKSFGVNVGGQMVVVFTEQFLQYDNKKNPFKAISDANIGLFLSYQNANNNTKIKSLDEDGSTLTETEVAYTYDAAGYPLTASSKTTSNGTVTTSTSTYTYQ